MRKLLRAIVAATLPVSYHDIKREPVLYLTFDDGPTRNTLQTLEVLARYAVPATFFVLGKRIAGNESILAKVHAAGHGIGNHSFSHQSARKLNYTKLSADLDHCTDQIKKVVPDWQPSLYRPPYGDLSFGYLRFALARRARVIMWSRDAVDYRAQTPGAILDRLAGLQNGDILLFHDEFPMTTTALNTLIPLCLSQGFRFARIQEINNRTMSGR